MQEARITISNVDIPFGRMVAIILKWMLASIPAVIIMWMAMMAVTLIFGGALAGCAALF